MKKLLIATVLFFAGIASAFAQPVQFNPWIYSPPLVYVPGGLTVQTPPSISAAAGFNISPGVAPTSPNNGDMWVTASGLSVQINGATVTIPSATITINGTNCTLGGSCSLSVTAASINIGTTTVLNGASGDILYQNGASPSGTIGELGTTGTAGSVVLSVGPTLTGTTTVATLNVTTFEVASTAYTFPAFTSTLVGLDITNTLGTGSTQTTILTSSNTGYANKLYVENSGTLSNASTNANITTTLTGTNVYANIETWGGTNPTADISIGSGVTGGFTVEGGSASSLTVLGGTAVGSTLTLESTSNGSPSGDSIIFKAGGLTQMTLASGGGVTLASLAGGGSQCVQVNNAGLLGVTGTACGSSSGSAPGSPTSSVQINAGAGAFAGITDWKSGGTSDLTGITGSTLAVGGATIGSLTFAVTGTAQISGNVGLGTESNPQAPLVISANTATGVSAQSGTYLQIISADGVSGLVGLINANNGTATIGGSLHFLNSRGTVASPSNMVSGDLIGAFGVRPYVNGGYVTASTANMQFSYVDTSPNKGTSIIFNTTPAGSTTRAQAMLIAAGVIIGSGSTDPGVGNLAVGGTTASTSTTTGAVTDAGGLGVVGAEYLGGVLHVASNIDPAANIVLPAGSSSTVGNLSLGGLLVFGIGSHNLFLDAGNYTLSGSGDVGIANGACGALTSGSNDLCIGPGAGSSVTSGSNDVIIGAAPGSAALAGAIILSDGAGNIRYDYGATTASTNTLTGPTTITGTAMLSSTLTYGSVTLNAAVTGTGNMVLSASPTLSGTIAGTLTFSGAATFSNTTDTSSGSTGAVNTAGGLGITKSLFVGTTATITGNLTVSSTTDATSISTGSIHTAGGLGIAKTLYVGTYLYDTDNSSGAYPTSVSGGNVQSAIGGDFTGGRAEADFWNNNTGAVISFNWYQQTGASAATLLASLGPTGAFKVASTITATLANAATTSAVCYSTSSGLFTYDGAIGTCNTSDETLKTFDRALHNPLGTLVALGQSQHFGYFHWDDPKYGSGERIGLGAQTLARFFPELTATGSDGLMSAAYDKLTVPIIAALGEIVESCHAAANDNFCKELLKRVSRK